MICKYCGSYDPFIKDKDSPCYGCMQDATLRALLQIKRPPAPLLAAIGGSDWREAS